MAVVALVSLWPAAPVLAAGAGQHTVAGAAGAAASSTASTALIVFLSPGGTPSGEGRPRTGAEDAVEAELAGVPSISPGIISATQGGYRTSQMLLDLGQGARVAYSAYSPARPPPISVSPVPAPGRSAAGRTAVAALGASSAASVRRWGAVLARAAGAPQILEPGLLASSLPGGAAYAGVLGQSTLDAVAAADRDGRIAGYSVGSAATLPRRVADALLAHRLVIADLPAGAGAYAQLRSLAAARPPRQLLIVVQRAPDRPGHELLWVGAAGLAGGGGRELTSDTTRQRGLIATVDLAPTVLAHLGVAVPSAMRGRALATDGTLANAYLRALKKRLTVVYGRRLPTLLWLVTIWALALAITVPLRSARPTVLRVGALGMLWAPVATLIPAALEPSRTLEKLIVAGVCLILAAVTDRLLAWPRGPLLPAVVGVVALSVDALAGTQLLIRSVLGPIPSLGVRFYGIGNELKSGLAVLVLAAVAAALYPAARSRRSAGIMAAAGAALAVVEGSARLGAGVGGVILVAAGTAVATVMLLPGRLTRRRTLLALVSPAAALVLLAALDLATAHGTGHFSGSVLHARSAGDLRDILARRYGAALDELRNGAMPEATAVALILSATALRWWRRLHPSLTDPGWRAALAGG